jgi:hypothetical protein
MNFIRRISNINNSKLKLGLYNTNKFFFKKRIGINHLDIQKLKKIDIDHQTMTERVNWLEEGAELQSHFYHELLFNILGE